MACMQLQVVVLLVVLSLWWSKWQLSGSLGTRLMMLYFLYLLLNVVRAPSPPTHTPQPTHAQGRTRFAFRRIVDPFPESHRAELLRVRQLIDRDVIPVLEPLRLALGMELVDCTNMRC